MQLSRLFPITKKAQPMAGDVMLVSYPRSGNTWMRYVLANLVEPTLEWNITNINRVVPDLHEGIPKDPLVTKPQIYKSHEASNEQPCKRVIYIFRDGRDVSVSLHDFCSKLHGYQKDFPEFLKEMLTGQMPYGSWQEHIESWVFDQHEAAVLAVCYENLCRDAPHELRRIAEFIGCEWSADEIDSALKKSTFEKQQKDFYMYKRDTHWNKGFRAGVQGSSCKWKSVFSEELNELFWSYAGDTATKLGYEKLTYAPEA